GPGWERVYPSQASSNRIGLTGRDFDMSALVDMYDRKAYGTNFSSTFSVPHTPAYRRLTFHGQNIDFGYYFLHTSGAQYADAVLARSVWPFVIDRTKLLS